MQAIDFLLASVCISLRSPSNHFVVLLRDLIVSLRDLIVPLRDPITPHYVNSGLIKLPVKLNTCVLIDDQILLLSLVSEQHN